MFVNFGCLDVFLKADVHLDDGTYARAAVPSGASTGEFLWSNIYLAFSTLIDLHNA